MIIAFSKAVALLLALCLIHGFIARKWLNGELIGKVLSGLLFGVVCIIGMETPVEVAPGVIFDARSVVLSISGLFGGPVVGVIAGVLAGGYRAWLGGAGAPVGLGVVISCVLLGVAYHHARRRGWVKVNILNLLLFGLIVHLDVIFIFSFLPAPFAEKVLTTIAIPMLLTFIPATAFLGYVIDTIEGEIRSTKSLAESRERFRDLIEGSVQGVLIHDGKTSFFANSAYAEIFGYGSARDVLAQGAPFSDFMPREHARLSSYAEARLSGREAPVSYEFEGVRRDGTSIWLDNRVRVVKWNDRPAIQATVVDITDRKRAEVALRAALVEARKADQAKSDFLAHMSHELRTPLNSILGFSQLLCSTFRTPLSDGKRREYAQDIQRSGEHLLSVIDDILDLSKIEAGQFTLTETTFDLNETLADIYQTIQGAVGDRAVTVEYAEDPALPHIHADRRAVTQVMLNLLSNGIRFNSKNGTVKLSAEVAENRAISIHVVDTGSGIAAEDIPRVLAPFGQARVRTDHTHGGTGLGLSISQQLMELHGGTLTLESEVGAGTTVTVSFPPERTVFQ